jgi:hypothetical protein
MIRTLTRLADGLVGAAAPKATAQAAPDCFQLTCYCSGPKLYKKTCCGTSSNCGACYSVGNYC